MWKNIVNETVFVRARSNFQFISVSRENNKRLCVNKHLADTNINKPASVVERLPNVHVWWHRMLLCLLNNSYQIIHLVVVRKNILSRTTMEHINGHVRTEVFLQLNLDDFAFIVHILGEPNSQRRTAT